MVSLANHIVCQRHHGLSGVINEEGSMREVSVVMYNDIVSVSHIVTIRTRDHITHALRVASRRGDRCRYIETMEICYDNFIVQIYIIIYYLHNYNYNVHV